MPDIKHLDHAIITISRGSYGRGKEVAEKLASLNSLIPLGMEIEGIYFENKVAVAANNDFIKNLLSNPLSSIIRMY